MPSLTLDTATSPHTQDEAYTQSHSPTHSTSPIHPPSYSPITPTLSHSRPAPTFTHTSQPPAVAIPQPPPEPIDFSSNPDVLALKATISILQQQKRTAEGDMKILASTKERALRDPERFVGDLMAGRIKTRGDGLFNPSFVGESDGDEEMEEGEQEAEAQHEQAKNEDKWEPLPRSQNVVRMPAVNWEQYGVVGDSLDKLHRDFVRRPIEGTPRRMGNDGQWNIGAEGQNSRREYIGVAAPYDPFKDKIDPPNAKEFGKR